MVDQALGAGGLLVERRANALLDLGAVALQRASRPSAGACGPRARPVAGLARLGGRFAAGGGAAALGPLQRAAQLGAVGLDLFLGAAAVGERLDQLGDAVADAEDDADREVDRGLGDGLDLVLLGGGCGGRLGGGGGGARISCFGGGALPGALLPLLLLCVAMKIESLRVSIACLGRSRV